MYPTDRYTLCVTRRHNPYDLYSNSSQNWTFWSGPGAKIRAFCHAHQPTHPSTPPANVYLTYKPKPSRFMAPHSTCSCLLQHEEIWYITFTRYCNVFLHKTCQYLIHKYIFQDIPYHERKDISRSMHLRYTYFNIFAVRSFTNTPHLRAASSHIRGSFLEKKVHKRGSGGP